LFHAPDNRPVTKELARLYIERNDPRHALPKLQVLFKADPRDLDVLRLLARAFEGLEQRPKAVSVYKELGRILTETGDQRGAVEVYQQILTIQPDDADAAQVVRNNPGLARAGGPPPPKKGGSGQAPRFPAPSARPVTAGGVPSRTHATGAERALDSGGHRALQVPAAREQPTVRPGMIPPADSESTEDVVAEEIAKILSETDVYIKYNLHAKAIEHLQRVFERAPRHTAAREKLKALYITTGKKDDAILELWALAEQAEPGRARRYVREIYELDSNNARAAQILGEPVGGSARRPQPAPEVVDDFGIAPPDDFSLLNARKPDPPTRRGHVVPEPDDDADAEDLSFADALDVEDDIAVEADLEEVVEENAVALDPIGEVDPLAVGDEDDDLIPVVIDTGSSRPIAVSAPDEDADRFSLDSEEDETSFASAGPDAETRFGGEIRGIAAPLPALAFDGTEDATGTEQMTELPSFADISRPGFVEGGTQKSSVDELASFEDPSQRAFIEARTQHQSSDEPAASIGGQREIEITPEPRAMPGGSVRKPAPIPEPIRADSSLEDDLDESEFFMQQSLFEEARGMLTSLLERYPEHPLVSAKMRELEALEAAQSPLAEAEPEAPLDPPPLEPTPEPGPAAETFDSGEMQSLQHETPNGTVEVTRRGVIERGVSAEDFETHYDLGIAYKEMGLVDEAMNEFRQVMKDPKREVQCHLMLGLCFIEKQSYTEAINQFKKGLYVEGITDPEALSLYYELGQAYEKIGDPREALYYYDKVQKRDPKFRDLSRRLRALRGEEPEVEPPSRSEDLDAAFDSLLEEG
jgi:tetratricopeptide (TPR) repeat protein